MCRYSAVVTLVLSVLAGAASDVCAQSAYTKRLDVTALPAPCPSAVPTSPSVPGSAGVDDEAFQCALTLLGTTGGEVYIPAGEYILAETLLVENRSVAFRGEGQWITRLVSTNTEDGLRFTSNTLINNTLAVRSLSLLKRSTNGGAAIKAEWPRTTQGHTQFGGVTTTIEDVHIGTDPWPSETVYWHFGIRLVNATQAKISLFNIQGSSDHGGVAGIQVGGGNVAPADAVTSISTEIRNGAIMKYVRGIESIELSEGLHVQDVLMREVGKGVEMTGGLGTTIANNEILARQCGIELTQSQAVNVTNNLIYKFANEPTFCGIRVGNQPLASNRFRFNRISGNSIHSSDSAPCPQNNLNCRSGIILDAQSGTELHHTVVQGNTTSNMGKGIVLSSTGVKSSLVMGNINSGAATAIDDGGDPMNKLITHNH